MDIDGDGYYDFFYSNVSKKNSTISKIDDEKYKIDLDGDNKWDFIYDLKNDILSKIEIKNKDMYPILPFTISFIIIIVVVIAILLTAFYYKRH